MQFARRNATIPMPYLDLRTVQRWQTRKMVPTRDKRNALVFVRLLAHLLPVL